MYSYDQRQILAHRLACEIDSLVGCTDIPFVRCYNVAMRFITHFENTHNDSEISRFINLDYTALELLDMMESSFTTPKVQQTDLARAQRAQRRIMVARYTLLNPPTTPQFTVGTPVFLK